MRSSTFRREKAADHEREGSHSCVKGVLALSMPVTVAQAIQGAFVTHRYLPATTFAIVRTGIVRFDGEQLRIYRGTQDRPYSENVT